MLPSFRAEYNEKVQQNITQGCNQGQIKQNWYKAPLGRTTSHIDNVALRGNNTFVAL